MEREVFWNWKEDDKTYLLTNWLSGLIPAGSYRGFNPHAVSGWTIELRHGNNSDNGYTDYDQAKTPTVSVGIWVSPQGSVIKRSTNVSLTLDAAHATLDRIDLLIGQHGYSSVPGGNPPVYYVAKGTPSVTPTPPTVSVAPTDVILATVLVKGGTASITDAGNVLTRSRVPSLGNSPLPLIDLLDKGVSSVSYNNAVSKDQFALELFYSDFDITGFVNIITGVDSLNIDSNKLYVMKAGLGRKYINDDGNQIYMPRSGFGVYKGRLYSIPAFSTTSIVMPPAKKLVYDPAGNYKTGITAVPIGDAVTSPKAVIPVADVRFFNSPEFYNDWTVVAMDGTVTVLETVRVKRVGQIVNFWGRVTVPAALIDGDSGFGVFSMELPEFVRVDVSNIEIIQVTGSQAPYGTTANNLVWWSAANNKLGTTYAQGGTISDPITIDLRGKSFILPETYTF